MPSLRATLATFALPFVPFPSPRNWISRRAYAAFTDRTVASTMPIVPPAESS